MLGFGLRFGNDRSVKVGNKIRLIYPAEYFFF